jgi:hypothetical protein
MSLRRWTLCAALGLALLAGMPTAAAASAASGGASMSAGAAPYRDDAALAMALRAIPGVSAALVSGQQRRAAVLVNAWLAPQIAASADSTTLLQTFGSSGHDILNAFAARDGGVFCDGAADTLVAALRLLGISAFRFDFGYAEGGMTHTTVVVHAEGRYWLVDPTFALDLQGADGRPLDLVAGWQAAADGVRHAVTMRTADLSARPMVGVADPRATCAENPSGWTMCSLGSFLRGFAAAMRAAGYPADEHGFLLMTLRSPLFYPTYYGVPDELLQLRSAIQREPAPVRVVTTRRGRSSVAVTIRNVRRYAAPAVVTLRVGRVQRSHALVVPAGAQERLVFHLAPGRQALSARVALARYPS